MQLNYSKEWFEQHINNDEGECGCCNPGALETCVVCGVQTLIPKHLHVDQREHYVDGAGQLCEKCFMMQL